MAVRPATMVGLDCQALAAAAVAVVADPVADRHGSVTHTFGYQSGNGFCTITW